MQVGNLVRFKKTGELGLITLAWLDENDEISVMVEFPNTAHIFWSHGHHAGRLESKSGRSIKQLEIIREV